VRLRALADDAGPLRREIRAKDRAQVFEYPALDMVNIRSIMRTPVRNSFSEVSRGRRFRSSADRPSRGVPLPITTPRAGGIRLLAGAAARVLTVPLATTGSSDGRARRGRGDRHALWPRVAAPFPPTA